MALALYGGVSLRFRRNQLLAELERETQSLGHTLRLSIESCLSASRHLRSAIELERQDQTVGSALGRLLEEALAAQDPIPLLKKVGAGDATLRIVWLDENSKLSSVQETRLRHVQITGDPWGEHITAQGRPLYAYTVPIRDGNRTLIGALDLQRDESGLEQSLSTSERNLILTALLVGLAFASLIWWTTRRTIATPLNRLLLGIDEVAHGDLTRALLRGRPDEIGDLAERFNQMTASLREARAEARRGVETKLALEARLRQSEKLATIGQLAATIAHEAGTPLNVIGGRARAMEKRATDGAEVAKNAAIIAAQASRITKIIQRLLDFSRQKNSDRQPVDLSRVLLDSLEFLDHQLSSAGIQVKLEPFSPESSEAPTVATVLADADQLQQVCLNLCLNAIQAMESGGQLDLGLRGVCRRKPGLETALPGRYVLLTVDDTGIGIPAEEREKIFEPFYTTKFDRGGTGLGLAVAHGIVKDHDGWIEIEDRPTGGTRFRVFLPATS